MKSDNSFLKGTLILTVSSIVVKVIGALNWILLSRVLGGEGIGLYQMGFPIYLMAITVSSAGIPVAISIVTAEKVAQNDFKGAERVFHVTLRLLFVTGMAFSLALFFGAQKLIDWQFIRDARAYYSIIALAPAVFFVTFLASFRGYLQGWQIMTPTACSEITEQLVRVVTMLFFASYFLPRGLAAAAGGASMGAGAGAFCALLVLMFFYQRLKKDLKAKQNLQNMDAVQETSSSIISRLLKLALPVSLTSLMLPIVANLDLLIVPQRLEAAGFDVRHATELFGYLTGMAVPLVNLSTIFTAALAISLVPAISEARALGWKESIRHKTGVAFRVAMIVTFPCFAGLFCLAEKVAGLIYNAPGAAPAIQVMSVGIVSAGALKTDHSKYTPSAGVDTYKYYLAMPGCWINDSTHDNNDAPGCYWWDAADNPGDRFSNGWPGYEMDKEDSEKNLYSIQAPQVAAAVVFSNYLDGGMDSTKPEFSQALQCKNSPAEYYNEGESDNYSPKFWKYMWKLYYC